MKTTALRSRKECDRNRSKEKPKPLDSTAAGRAASEGGDGHTLGGVLPKTGFGCMLKEFLRRHKC